MQNFTPRAQQVLQLARKEADRLQAGEVGTEHLLLGLLNLGQGVGANVLARMGVALEEIAANLEVASSNRIAGGASSGNVPFSSRVKMVLALAGTEAREMNHSYVGTEHMLLGVLREGTGQAAKSLVALGLQLEALRTAILKELDPNYDEAEIEAQTFTDHRLIHALDEIIETLKAQKEARIRDQAFDRAANLRDEERDAREMRARVGGALSASAASKRGLPLDPAERSLEELAAEHLDDDERAQFRTWFEMVNAPLSYAAVLAEPSQLDRFFAGERLDGDRPPEWAFRRQPPALWAAWMEVVHGQDVRGASGETEA